MKKYVAIAPKEGKIADYLTNGKEYPIILFDTYKGRPAAFCEYGFAFDIIDDIGGVCNCLENSCAHLLGKNWTIKEVKP
jgi:hypothetical protein